MHPFKLQITLLTKLIVDVVSRRFQGPSPVLRGSTNKGCFPVFKGGCMVVQLGKFVYVHVVILSIYLQVVTDSTCTLLRPVFNTCMYIVCYRQHYTYIVQMFNKHKMTSFIIHLQTETLILSTPASPVMFSGKSIYFISLIPKHAYPLGSNLFHS